MLADINVVVKRLLRGISLGLIIFEGSHVVCIQLGVAVIVTVRIAWWCAVCFTTATATAIRNLSWSRFLSFFDCRQACCSYVTTWFQASRWEQQPCFESPLSGLSETVIHFLQFRTDTWCPNSST